MRGEGLGSQAYYKAPAYEWLVGQLYRVVGPRLQVVYALQMLGGVLTAVLTAALGMRWFGLGAGIVCGALSGLYVQLPYFENQLLIESSALFFSVLAVFLLERGGSVWFDLAAGAAAGVAVQLRPVNAALIAALLVWLSLQRRAAGVRLRRAACLFVPVLLLLVPTIRHNRLATGHRQPDRVRARHGHEERQLARHAVLERLRGRDHAARRGRDRELRLAADQLEHLEFANGQLGQAIAVGRGGGTGRPAGSLGVRLPELLRLPRRDLRVSRLLRRAGRIQLLLPPGLPPAAGRVPRGLPP